jgi:hypothetical protein
MGDQPEPRPPLTVAEELYFGGVAPTQGEGTLSDGRHYYLRIRHTTASLWVGDMPFDQHELGVDGRVVAISAHGDDNDSHIWSYVPEVHARALLALLLWMLDDAERSEAAIAADRQPAEAEAKVPGA